MASPYVAGCAALLKQRFPNITTREVHSLLQQTSNIVTTPINAIHPSAPTAAPIQGTGLIDCYAALSAFVRLEPAVVNLGQSAGKPPVRNVRLVLNNSMSAENGEEGVVRFKVVHQAFRTVDLNRERDEVVGEEEVVRFADDAIYNAQVAFSLPEENGDGANRDETGSFVVEVPAGQTRSIQIAITPPPTMSKASASRGQLMYGGAVLFIPDRLNHPTLHTTYVGVAGDYAALPILPSNGTFPRITKLPENTIFYAHPVAYSGSHTPTPSPSDNQGKNDGTRIRNATTIKQTLATFRKMAIIQNISCKVGGNYVRDSGSATAAATGAVAQKA
ncbi:hypothetical protein HK102_008151 [Quaeritorhiza haematococci]|nr:hypothetical protein HK102_008151 [Quaeritorhiza haematococci]